jgi:serine protease Do
MVHRCAFRKRPTHTHASRVRGPGTALSSTRIERQILSRDPIVVLPTSRIPPFVSSVVRTARGVVSSLALAIMLASMLAITLGPLAMQAQNAPAATTSDVFRRFADRVVKIQVVETGSSAKSTIGSGFLSGDDGYVVTNYHVVSSVIATPGRYRTEVIDAHGATRPARVLAIDVVHDLAVLDAGMRGQPYFALEPVTLAQGNRLFSLGHPRDLGLSIVEGTHNGLLLHTLYPRIHLTGSLNPGMSGGPTIDDVGHVVGVNVSTAGNQVSFLVPVDRVIALLARVRTPSGTREAPSLALVGRQLREYQDVYLRDIFDSTTRRIPFGPFMVVTQPAPFFRCWADASHEHEQSYERVWHRCATDTDIYLDADQSSGSLTVVHQLVTTKMLNAPRFYALYSKLFGSDDAPSGDESYVTNWECQTRNVRHDRTTMRTSLCLRRYRKLGELYDAVLKVAVLGRSDVGLVSTLSMTGVTFDNVDRVSRRYLRQIAWR